MTHTLESDLEIPANYTTSNLIRGDGSDCRSISSAVSSRIAQLIAIQTLGKIHPSKKSFYKKMLEGTLSLEEAVSLSKIVGRFLIDQTNIGLQVPENEYERLMHILDQFHTIGIESNDPFLLEILYKIVDTIGESSTLTDTLSRYGIYPIHMQKNLALIYTNTQGEQKAYLGNGKYDATIDYGAENNILYFGDTLYRRDTGEKIGSPKDGLHVVETQQGKQYLIYWDEILNKGIAYQYNSEEKIFEALTNAQKNVIFIRWNTEKLRIEHLGNLGEEVQYQ